MSTTARRSYIKSLGHYVPSRVVTNFDLEKMMDTTDEWIQQRSGIRERRWAEPGETCTHMAAEACKEALARANLQPDDIDCIIYACTVSDYTVPGGGVLTQRALGMKRTIPCYDVRNACSGFLYSTQMADAFIRLGIYNRILVVGSELQSTSLDTSTRGRDIAVLFGDGAGAAVFEVAPEGSKSFVIETEVYSQGEGAEFLYQKDPSPANFPRVAIGMQMGESFYPVMEGKTVFKNAVTRMPEAILHICKKNGFEVKDIDFVIAHQANMRINQMVLHSLEIPFEKTHHTLDRYGNTTGATIPLTLNEAVELGKVKRGDLVAFVGFGSGFTWGATLLRY